MSLFTERFPAYVTLWQFYCIKEIIYKHTHPSNQVVAMQPLLKKWTQPKLMVLAGEPRKNPYWPPVKEAINWAPTLVRAFVGDLMHNTAAKNAVRLAAHRISKTIQL